MVFHIARLYLQVYFLRHALSTLALVEQSDSGRRPVSIRVLIFTKHYNLRKSAFFDHISAKNKRFLHYNLRKSAFFNHISAENIYLRAIQKVITMDQLFV